MVDKSYMEKAFSIWEVEKKVRALERSVDRLYSDEAFTKRLVRIEAEVFNGRLSKGTMKRMEKW